MGCSLDWHEFIGNIEGNVLRKLCSYASRRLNVHRLARRY